MSNADDEDVTPDLTVSIDSENIESDNTWMVKN